MIKKDYLKELKFDKNIARGSKGIAAERVQEWINLYKWPKGQAPNLVTDGDFGKKTEAAVLKFQAFTNNIGASKLEEDGIVGKQTWEALVAPMSHAFSNGTVNKENYKTFREAIIPICKRHLEVHPRELNGKNEGPWVRAYMGGHDGNPWAWCVGSTLTVIDQTLSIFGKKFTSFYPNTYSCDVMGEHAKKKKTLIRNEELRSMSLTDLYKRVQPGDIVQVSKTPTDWTHCALILEVHDNHFVTWEGNTNDEGSREGYEVCKRTRNFRKSNLDVLIINL